MKVNFYLSIYWSTSNFFTKKSLQTWNNILCLCLILSIQALAEARSVDIVLDNPTPPVNMTQSYSTPGNYTFTVPDGVTSITVQTWGGGGRGGSRTSSSDGTGGGGGGAFSQHTFSVTPGQSYVVFVGAGSTSNASAGQDSWVSVIDAVSALVLAKGGNTVANNSTTGATGGSAASGIGTIKYSGGNGANRVSSTSSGGGGSSAGTGNNGTNASGTTGGIAPSGGGNGGNGRTNAGSGNPGFFPGGGGGGAVRDKNGSPSGGNGANGQVVISFTYDVNAGTDQTQCNNSLFFVSTNTPPTGYTASWSVISGNATIYDNSKLTIPVAVQAGSSATIRLQITNGTNTFTDDVVLTNTQSCTPNCINPLNLNGDLESSGTITNYNLSFQGTPASLIDDNNNPTGWSEGYGTNTPNTTTFTGAYHLNKTGVSGNPKSGSKYIYMAGSGFCLSSLKTNNLLECGKKFRVSVWIAAYSNQATQGNAPFVLEYFSGGPNVQDYNVNYNMIAPASNSWNNLNWQRYSFEITVPSAGYEWSNFVLTTQDNVHGIVIDDLCVEEIYDGALADAGPDMYGCNNTFTMAANTPEVNHTGSWSVVSGSATFSNVSSPTSNVTITSGNAARLRWTVTSTSGTYTVTEIDPEKEGGFENCCNAYDNGWTAVNHGTNQWHVGSASNPSSGNQAAYISNNSGTSYAYTNTSSQTSHLYRDLTVPLLATNITLAFNWKGAGESGFDRLLVYTAPTTVTPTAGTPASSSTTLTGATLVSSVNLHSSDNYQNLILSLPSSLAGTTFRLIFTWQNNNSVGGSRPASIDEVAFTYDLPACSSQDEINIAYSTNSFSVNNASICPAESATLTATGCNGSLSWSTGSTQTSITVTPTSTTNYSVTCTPSGSANLLLNPGYESATNLQNWDNWGNASITTTPADIYAGSKAVLINTIGTSYGGVAQGFTATPGTRYRIRVYAKMTNTNSLPTIRYQFWGAGNLIDDAPGVTVTSSAYQLYELNAVAPLGSDWLTVFAELGSGGQMFVDSWEVVSFNDCPRTALSTVTVGAIACPQMFNCDSKFYQTREINGEYFFTEIQTKPTVTITNLANLTQNGVTNGINSLVFNKSDGFIYGMAMTAPFTLYRVGSNYVVRNIGTVTGFPTDAFINAGDMVNGKIIYRNANDDDLYELNMSTLTVTKKCDFVYTNNNQSNVGDIALNPIDGKLYGTRNNSRKLIQYDLSNCTFQIITLSDSIPGAHGAFFISADGVGYGYQNSTGKFVEINLTTGLVQTVGQDVTTSQSDGCSCDGIKFIKTVSVSSTPTCSVYTYHFTIYNNWITPFTNVEFRDTLLNNLTWATNPFNVQNMTLGSTSLIGQNRAVFTIQNIPVGQSSFSISVNVPQSYNGGPIYSNQAYIHNLPSALNIVKASDNPLTPAIEDPTTINIIHSTISVSSSGNVSTCLNTGVSISANATGGTGIGYGYAWSPATGLSATNISNPVANPTTTTTYTVTVTDSSGCTSTTSLTVTVLPNPTAPVVGIITQPTCITPTGSVQLSGLPSSGTWTITRTPGGTTYIGTGTNYTITGLPPNATYTFKVRNSNNCESVSSASVSINPIPTNPIVGGASAICVGLTANVTPNTNGTWTSSNNAIATITNAGVVTGILAGTVTLTYTRTGDGCSNTHPFTVHATPSTPVVGTITQPTCPVPTGSVQLSNLPASGTWTLTRTPGGTTYSSTGTTYTVTGLPANATYTFVVTNANSCISGSSASVSINPVPSIPIVGGASTVCVGLNANVTPNSSGTWLSSDTDVATITNAGIVTGNAAGTVTLTYTRTVDGCANTIPFTVHANPTNPVIGTVTQPTCITTSGSVQLSNLPSSGTWTLTRTPGGTTYTGSGTTYTVSGLPPNATYTFTVTNTNNCTSESSTSVNINPIPSNPVVGGPSALCVGLTANVTPSTNGTWSSSNTSVATVTNSGLVTGIAQGSVTLTYTRTSDGCFSTLPFSVYDNPSTPVTGTVTQPNCPVPTGSVQLTGLPNSGTWTLTRTPGGTTYTGTVTSYTVTGLPPNATYTFTVTNNNNCVSGSSASVMINPVPTNPVAGGDAAICVGLTTNVTPATNGTWTSSNTSIATVTNGGLVSGIAGGTVTLTYTRNADGCTASLPFTVYDNPTAPIIGVITQPSCPSPTGSVVLNGLPTSGSWTLSQLPGGNTFTGSGTTYTVNNLAPNTTYTFRVTNSNGCVSATSSNVVINNPPPNPVLGGQNTVCVESAANVTPAANGTWSSSNSGIASVSNTGQVTGIAPGTVTLTYTRTSDLCSNSMPFTVYDLPLTPIIGEITQPTCILTTGSVILYDLPASGTWTVTRMPGNVSYMGTGTSYTVSSLPGNTAYTFEVTNSNACTSGTSNTVFINPIPENPSLGGDIDVCVGATTNVTPSSDGTWTSSNNAIATIDNSGLVTGVNAGSVTLTYTRTADGCQNNIPFTVHANPTAPIPGNVTQPTCTTPSGSVALSGLPATGTWTITRTPGGVTYSGTGTSFIIYGLPVNTTYTFTVENLNVCSSPASNEVVINDIPGAPIVGGTTGICVGLTANVTPSANGTWASSNSSVATVTNSGNVSGIAPGTVTLTYTRTSDGCSNTLPFYVYSNPNAPIVGTITQPTCISPSGSVVLSGLPATGTWTLIRTPGGITNTGSGDTYTVTNLTENTDYTFVVVNNNDCVSPSSTQVSINGIPSIPNLGGPSMACVGATATVTPSNLGTWTSSNPAIATITNSGVVTAISPGTVNLVYTRNNNGCSASKEFTVIAIPSAPLVGTVTQPNCATATASVELHGLPSMGTWTLTRTPGGNTYTGTGNSYTISGLPSATTYTFTVYTTQSCTSSPSDQVIINNIPSPPTATINFMGSVCITDNKQIRVDVSGGATPYNYQWTGPSGFTGNTQTINISQNGTYQVTVTDANFCLTTVSGNVNERFDPTIINTQSTICEGESVFLDISAINAISYAWSANAGSATSQSVTVTPSLPSSTYIVTITNNLGCTAVPSVTINVNPKPIVSINGPNTLCIGQTTNLIPSSGGSWVSSNSSVAAVTNSGLVTAISQGTATFIFTDSGTSCSSNATSAVTVIAKPTTTLAGPSNICVGNTTQLLPSSGVTWSSSNPSVAQINASGVVTGLAPGIVSFTYTQASSGCSSDASTEITVGPGLSATIDYNGSFCLTDTSTLSLNITGGTPNFTYAWTGPLSFTANTPVVNITLNGNYHVTVTDSYGCKANVSGYVHQRFEPYIVNMGATLCEGQSANITVNASSAISYLWGANAGNSTSATVTVFPLPPATTYLVTVTNDLGCKAVAQTTFNVYPKPVIYITGNNPICVGQTSQMSETSGGTWTSLNPGVATINNAGQITGISAGYARFIFTKSVTNCVSDTSLFLQVNGITSTGYVGPDQLCCGEQSSVNPSTGGTWTSLQPAIASITPDGVITAVSPGQASLRFTNDLGCTTNNDLLLLVHDKPSILLDGPDEICMGENTQWLPSAGGTWISSNSAVATIGNNGSVTAISPGTARFVFTSAFSGCSSDSSDIITVKPPSVVSITGSDIVCIGNQTTLSPASGGMWISSNPSVASVTNDGVVTGISAGSATFTYYDFSGACPSMPTQPVTIQALPEVSISGPSSICINGTTNVLPSTGGSWQSMQPTIASVTNDGTITGIAVGIANFVFTNIETGCSSLPTEDITVYNKPTIDIVNGTICVESTTQLIPSAPGSWTSSNPAVATVTNTGLVTGISEGTALFTFVEQGSGCASDPGAEVNVYAKPIISVIGPDAICVGQNSQLSPISGGSWQSEFPGVASVSNSGVVTALSGGTTNFIFTSNTGCQSNPGASITIHANPIITITGPSDICIGSTTQLSPASGGTWESSRPGVASVTNAGLVTGVSTGTARFVFTNTETGCVSDSSTIIEVLPSPFIVLAGPSQICTEQTSQLSPSSGGTWVSLNPSIASVTSTGLISGMSAGVVSFRFIDNNTACESILENVLTVLPRPTVSISGSNTICVGSSTQLLPNEGGTWISMNPVVAAVNNSGLVVGIGEGQATFKFTSSATGCISGATLPVTVLGTQNPVLDGPSSICIGANTRFLPSTGGSWTSSNPNIATITNEGWVTGVGSGTVNFFFTDSITGCISGASSTITVYPEAQLFISGDSDLCVGFQTVLSSSSSGVWYSDRPSIALITSTGLVTGNAPGKVSFYFVETSTGCVTYLPDDIISVSNCFDPDFNATLVNVALMGNVSTNDEIPVGTSYHPTYQVISKPVNSNPVLVILPNGNYTFQANIPGRYEYEIQVCYQGILLNCLGSNLIIHVVNATSPNQHILPNTDINYTFENEVTTIISTANDRCNAPGICEIDTNAISILIPPTHGNAVLLPNGNISYTPDLNFVGQDTIISMICASNASLNCQISTQIVTVLAVNALNSLSASDDFYIINKGGSVENKNLLLNDRDPENENISIMSQGSLVNPVTIASGQYYIDQNGSLFFNPHFWFTGPVDIVYTVCDNENYCVNATVHILVTDNLKIKVRAYLEGALMENGDLRSSDNRPLMRDDLRVHPVLGQNFIPTQDPYSYPTQYNDLTSLYAHVGAGGQVRYRNIVDSATVFGVTGENAIVDWVFIELRSKSDSSFVLATRSALIQRDGDVVDLDGTSFLEFPGLSADSCYIVLRHRNHFGIMSLLVPASELVDFTLPTTPVFDFGTTQQNGYDYTGLAQKAEVVSGYMAMWAGDFDGNGRLKFINPSDDQNILFIEVLTYNSNNDFTANYNFGYGYLQGDYNLNGKSKYDNPDDDKNMLFYQILFYPLNVNYISNFNIIIQQVPEASNN